MSTNAAQVTNMVKQKQNKTGVANSRELFFRKLKFWSKSTPRFLVDIDGFASIPMRVNGKRDKYFFRCCSCRIDVANQQQKTRVPVSPEPAHNSVSVIDNNNDDTEIRECCELSPCNGRVVLFTLLTTFLIYYY